MQLRKKEGAYGLQIAVLEQQLAQIKIEMEQALKREDSHRQMYDRILKVINDQFQQGAGQIDRAVS